MTTQTLALFFLGMMSVGGIAWVFLYPILSGEKKMEQRRETFAAADRAMRTSPSRGPKDRREQVEETLKALEEKQKAASRPSLPVRFNQAGVNWTVRGFMIGSSLIGLAVFSLVWLMDFGLLPAAGMGFAAAFGLPRWLLSFLKKRRENQFLHVFPDAVDVIVRGIKAGLPLLDCLKMIASEAPEPVRSEFQQIVETQTVGIPLAEACVKLYERVPLPEANFFGIVISIQQKAGGNLSEALGNLSKVLRERKKMKAKIKAMSMEAKASAMIIGALPIAVMLLVYLTSPKYIELLWTESLGRFMMACCAMWMFTGVMVMRKMINFDF